MLTDKELQDIAHPMMNGNSFNNLTAAVEYGRRVLAAASALPVAEDAWRSVPVTMPFLAELFDAFCGADGHNLVVKLAASIAGQKL